MPAELRGKTRMKKFDTPFSIVIARGRIFQTSPTVPCSTNVSMAKRFSSRLIDLTDQIVRRLLPDVYWQLFAFVSKTTEVIFFFCTHLYPYESTMFWGSSPCVDLGAYGAGSGHLKILIVSAGDTRHVLQTLAKRYKYSYAKIDIYVYEPVVELYARHAQQLALALEPIDRVSLSYKVRAAIRNPHVRAGTQELDFTLANERFFSLSFLPSTLER